jgi:hypothetical protein
MHLPVVHGKVSLPDLRIEYANQDMEIARVDLDSRSVTTTPAILRKGLASAFKSMLVRKPQQAFAASAMTAKS